MPTIDTTIHNYNDIKKHFQNADILLGNGFSINIWNKLHYSSLFQTFMIKQNTGNQKFFSSFKTVNFEEILDKLQSASFINSILGMDTTTINSLADSLKNGLIESVNDVHPKFSELDSIVIKNIAKEMTSFSTIYTLNYDVILYYIILSILDEWKTNKAVKRFSDRFYQPYNGNLAFDSVWNYKWDPYPKFVYFLHGALFLFRDNHELVKLKLDPTNNEDLLTLITKKIKNSEFPLFVSEGTSPEKEKAISRSGYLSFANEEFKRSARNIVIYGASLSDSDKHIRDIIVRKSSKIAISIHCSGRKQEEIENEVLRISSYFGKFKPQFFDSSTIF